MLEPGQTFASRYRIRRCIAEGGMGAIFEAEHVATERRVALKLLFPHIMSVASARQKFELEAKISARVNSPYIVEVLDAGFDEASKSPYLVMELLDGQTLAARVHEGGPLSSDEALRLLEQVAAGLDAAHAYREPGGAPKPIVHRDLKPENLFLARQHDGSIIAKILDYGIAKVLGDTTHISQEVRGTPLFMAFEQITAASLSPQTDVWAFGLIAYHMLTGARYWRAAERQGSSVQALFAEILTLPLVAPSVRLREQDSAVVLPPAFDAWLLRCIDRDPSQRFPSAGAAIEALGGVFERAPRADAARSSPALLAPVNNRTQTFIGVDPAARAAAAAASAATAPTQKASSTGSSRQPATGPAASPSGSSPSASSPSGATPSGATPSAATPSGSSPAGAAHAATSNAAGSNAAASNPAASNPASSSSLTPNAASAMPATAHGSVPALSATRFRRAFPARLMTSPLHWAALGAGGGVLVLGTLFWLLSSGDAAPPRASSPVADPASAVHAARPSPEAASPARPPARAPAGDVAPPTDPAAPRIRIAPLDETPPSALDSLGQGVGVPGTAGAGVPGTGVSGASGASVPGVSPVSPASPASPETSPGVTLAPPSSSGSPAGAPTDAMPGSSEGSSASASKPTPTSPAPARPSPPKRPRKPIGSGEAYKTR